MLEHPCKGEVLPSKILMAKSESKGHPPENEQKAPESSETSKTSPRPSSQPAFYIVLQANPFHFSSVNHLGPGAPTPVPRSPTYAEPR